MNMGAKKVGWTCSNAWRPAGTPVLDQGLPPHVRGNAGEGMGSSRKSLVP